MSSISGLRKRAGAVLGTTALLVAGGVATALPAAAGPNCPAGYHCVFSASIYNSTKHAYFNSDANFTDDYFEIYTNMVVNDAVHAASNSSTGGYESHYYKDINYGGGLLFCVNPGSSVDSSQLEHYGNDGDGWGTSGEASSLQVRSTTSISCF
ncbi:hypothetical protein SLA_1932 [Streptomyces laurentii]|uniref:Peptidase inhibitor family I36 n=1 Tax=Streptomyces laurentii TaxID=39478 RepID=A0A160NYD7_STRLU|nr:hypothetical protein SLA_1932 [Streptomyces laurentii]